MSFVWQPRDLAAQTLGVDLPTLQKWIESGQAPTRDNHGSIEVLIEFPDDADPEPAVDVDVDPPPASATGPHALEVVPRRELQLAGAMAGAWQRMAEFAEAELRRSRRTAAIVALALALLALFAGVGIWYATRATVAARGEAQSTAERLADVSSQRRSLETASDELTARIATLTAELAETREKLAASTERAAQLTAASERAAADHVARLAERDARVADLARQLDDLRKQLEGARADAANLRRQSESDQQRLRQLEAEFEKAKAAPTPSTPSPSPSPDLKSDKPGV